MKRLLVLLVLAGCPTPQTSKAVCKEQGGKVIVDGAPVCEKVSTCHETLFAKMECRERVECEDGPWHCELPAEAN